MKVESGKIVEATEEELFDYYLTRRWDDVMSFQDYKRECMANGTKILKAPNAYHKKERKPKNG